MVQNQHLLQIHHESENSGNNSRLHYVLHFIHEHLTEKIAVNTLSCKAYLNRSEFFRWFKEQFGITPLDYINKERLKLAKQLLSDKKSSISEVSCQCGFADVNYFIRLFKKNEGITPSSYKGCL